MNILSQEQSRPLLLWGSPRVSHRSHHQGARSGLDVYRSWCGLHRVLATASLDD